jgi:aldehyde dehydrogenase (NAD+)
VLTNVRADHPIMGEEIFGPVLPVIAYDQIDEALALVRSREKPLALYVFAEDSAFIETVLSETTAGGTTVNDCALHIANPHLPFGGVGPSGLGRYHGEFGFREFSHERGILRQSTLSPVRMLQPPYTETVQTLVKWVQKIL